jgi:hypothetical protein
LLAACDLASDEALARMAADGGLDWERLALLADEHGMGPIAGARLGEVAPGAMPEPLAARFRVAEREAGATMSAQAATAARLSRLLGQAGIRSIFLKGVPLAHLLYAPHPEWRRASDIDLLVARDDFLEADRLLRAAGYERTWPAGDLPRGGVDMFLHLANVFTYVARGTGLLVELHHRISLNPHWLPSSFEALHAGSVEVDTASGPVRGLDGPLAVSYLVWHALGHDGYRLKWFCDIARALRRAQAKSCAGYLAGEVEQTSVLPLRIADEVISALLSGVGDADAAPIGADAARVLADMERPAGLGRRRSLAALSAEFTNLRFLLRLSPNGPARRYQLLRTLCDPRDVAALRLPRRFTPLYAALGPALALRRLLTRGGDR